MATKRPFRAGRSRAIPPREAGGRVPRRARNALILGLFAWFTNGCMVGPNFQMPGAAVQPQWKKYAGAADRPAAAPDSSWWRSFGDHTLDNLIERAYRENPSLQAAGVRILEARARLNRSIGNLFPQQQFGSATAGAYLSPDGAQTSGGLFDPGQLVFASQGIVSASWEIDFWGKYRRQIQSDRATYLASLAAYDDILVSLVADVAAAYTSLRTAQARLEVARENLAREADNLRLTEARAKAGDSSPLDVEQAHTRMKRTEADLSVYQADADRAANALAVLVGIPPAALRVGPGSLASLPDGIATGVPRDLLRRRPDVREAGLRAAAQSARIGVEFAQLLPSFSLNGTFGYATGQSRNNSLSDVFNWQDTIATSAGSLVVPIFNYGRLTNNVRVEDAKFQQAILRYQEVVLRAQREVEDALSAFANSRTRIAQLASAAASAERASALARVRYEAGEVDYTTVLTTDEARLEVDDALAVAQGNGWLALIAAYRALGGGWESRQGSAVISESVRQEMARRTDWGRLLDPARYLPKKGAEDPALGVKPTPAPGS